MGYYIDSSTDVVAELHAPAAPALAWPADAEVATADGTPRADVTIADCGLC